MVTEECSAPGPTFISFKVHLKSFCSTALLISPFALITEVSIDFLTVYLNPLVLIHYCLYRKSSIVNLYGRLHIMKV